MAKKSGGSAPNTIRSGFLQKGRKKQKTPERASQQTPCCKCGETGRAIQISCANCEAYICDNCHWCSDHHHEIRLCDRCRTTLCRDCDEMDICHECLVAHCQHCTTMDECVGCHEIFCLSEEGGGKNAEGDCATYCSGDDCDAALCRECWWACKFCAAVMCENCSSSCGKCGVVVCARDEKFLVACDICELPYCLVCIAQRQPCVRCSRPPGKRLQKMVQLRLKSINKAVKSGDKDKVATYFGSIGAMAAELMAAAPSTAAAAAALAAAAASVEREVQVAEDSHTCGHNSSGNNGGGCSHHHHNHHGNGHAGHHNSNHVNAEMVMEDESDRLAAEDEEAELAARAAELELMADILEEERRTKNARLKKLKKKKKKRDSKGGKNGEDDLDVDGDDAEDGAVSTSPGRDSPPRAPPPAPIPVPEPPPPAAPVVPPRVEAPAAAPSGKKKGGGAKKGGGENKIAAKKPSAATVIPSIPPPALSARISDAELLKFVKFVLSGAGSVSPRSVKLHFSGRLEDDIVSDVLASAGAGNTTRAVASCAEMLSLSMDSPKSAKALSPAPEKVSRLSELQQRREAANASTLKKGLKGNVGVIPSSSDTIKGKAESVKVDNSDSLVKQFSDSKLGGSEAQQGTPLEALMEVLEKRLKEAIAEESEEALLEILEDVKGQIGLNSIRKAAKKHLKGMRLLAKEQDAADEEERKKAEEETAVRQKESAARKEKQRKESAAVAGARVPPSPPRGVPASQKQSAKAGLTVGTAASAGVPKPSQRTSPQQGQHRPPHMIPPSTYVPQLRPPVPSRSVSGASPHSKTASATTAAVPGATDVVIDLDTRVVGWVIGKGGTRIRDMQVQSGARMWVDQHLADGRPMPDDVPRKLHIQGTEQQVKAAKSMALHLVDSAPSYYQPVSQPVLAQIVTPAAPSQHQPPLESGPPATGYPPARGWGPIPQTQAQPIQVLQEQAKPKAKEQKEQPPTPAAPEKSQTQTKSPQVVSTPPPPPPPVPQGLIPGTGGGVVLQDLDLLPSHLGGLLTGSRPHIPAEDAGVVAGAPGAARTTSSIGQSNSTPPSIPMSYGMAVAGASASNGPSGIAKLLDDSTPAAATTQQWNGFSSFSNLSIGASNIDDTTSSNLSMFGQMFTASSAPGTTTPVRPDIPDLSSDGLEDATDGIDDIMAHSSIFLSISDYL